MYEKWKKKTRREVNMPGVGDEGDDRPRPNFKANRHVKEELRSAQDIRKFKKEKDNKKMKNLSKDKRTKLEGKARKAKKATEAGKQYTGPKAGRRKTKAILRV
jgi:hypothetical protein